MSANPRQDLFKPEPSGKFAGKIKIKMPPCAFSRSISLISRLMSLRRPAAHPGSGRLTVLLPGSRSCGTQLTDILVLKNKWGVFKCLCGFFKTVVR